MARIFGTDGIRGKANVDLTPELTLSLGRALGTVLHEGGSKRPTVLIGRDPRWSGEMLDAALIAGLTSAGADAVSVGVVPTPAVAHLTKRSSASAGVMISRLAQPGRRQRHQDLRSRTGSSSVRRRGGPARAS